MATRRASRLWWSCTVGQAGVGQTKYQSTSGDVSIAGLVREASLRALADAGLEWADIDAVVIGKAPDFFEGVMMPEIILGEARRGRQAGAPCAQRGIRGRVDRDRGFDARRGTRAPPRARPRLREAERVQRDVGPLAPARLPDLDQRAMWIVSAGA